MRIIFFLLVFSVENVAAMFDPSKIDYSPVREYLSSIKPSLTLERTLKFIQEKSDVEEIAERTKAVLSTGDVEAYDVLSLDIESNVMPYTCECIFKSDRANKFIAQFMLSGLIITMFNASENGSLLISALSSLNVSAVNGEDVIQSYFNLDVTLLLEKIRIIEQANPDIWL